MLLLAVPEAVLSHTKTRSRSAVQSILSLAPRCPRGSLVPYKSEEHQFCGALLTERTVCGMALDPGPVDLQKETKCFQGPLTLAGPVVAVCPPPPGGPPTRPCPPPEVGGPALRGPPAGGSSVIPWRTLLPSIWSPTRYSHC